MLPSESAGHTSLKAVMLPWTDGNPYQTLLKQGVEATGTQVFPATIAENWKAKIAQIQPDVLHLHWLHNLSVSRTVPRTLLKAADFLNTLRRVRNQVPGVVWTCHNLANHQGWCLGLERRIIRVACKYFDRIIVHHREAVEDVISYFRIPEMRERFDVIPHGHYLDWYPGGVSKQVARQRFGIRDDEIVFLLFGQLRSNKGIEPLIAAFQQLSKTCEARLRLVLAGTAEPAISKLLIQAASQEPCIDFREGFVADDQVQPLHAIADVAVLPFSTGLTSGSLILAMGYGLPVVAAKLGEAGQMADRWGGIFLHGNQIADLQLALHQMILARADWDKMGLLNRQLCIERDWISIGNQTVASYRRAIQNQ